MTRVRPRSRPHHPNGSSRTKINRLWRSNLASSLPTPYLWLLAAAFSSLADACLAASALSASISASLALTLPSHRAASEAFFTLPPPPPPPPPPPVVDVVPASGSSLSPLGPPGPLVLLLVLVPLPVKGGDGPTATGLVVRWPLLLLTVPLRGGDRPPGKGLVVRRPLLPPPSVETLASSTAETPFEAVEGCVSPGWEGPPHGVAAGPIRGAGLASELGVGGRPSEVAGVPFAAEMAAPSRAPSSPGATPLSPPLRTAVSLSFVAPPHRSSAFHFINRVYP